MKIIKPLRLSMLNRPFRWQGKNHLAVSVLALSDMGPTPQLRPEMELWQLAASELQTCGGVVDMAIPKVCAEFMATGFAYTHHQEEKSVCVARIDIENLSKSLVVFGDRYWVHSKMSLPQTFSEMRLDWSRAYGGRDYADNPHGVGFRSREHSEHERHPLPNIEPLEGQITSPKQTQQPAGFGPLDIQWPRRFSRMGKKYDASWLKNEFPGFARDIDWTIFNAASPDQWWEDRDTLPPQAKWRIWNMHPEKPLQEGQLPPWQARCFVNRQHGDVTVFEEIAMRATTVWFFPHMEQMILIWQGLIRINEDDAADVLQLIPALEKQGAARPVSHYRKVLVQRMDKEMGAMFSLREKDLLPEESIGQWLDNEVELPSSPLQNNMINRSQLLHDQHQVSIEANDGDGGPMLTDLEVPEIPTLESLPEYIEKMELLAQKMLAEAEQRNRDIAAQYPQWDNDDNQRYGPGSMYRMQEMLHQHQPDLSEKKRAQMREALHQMYLAAVQHQPSAVRLRGDPAQILRLQAERTQAQGGNFSNMDLTGIDFSGMDLRGANFNKALLECANLSRCNLDNANFQGAVLARVELLQSSLRGCNFSGANLALAKCQGSDFCSARFAETQLQNALFDECIFDNAILDSLILREISLIRCQFRQAVLDGCIFMELTLAEPDFSHAQLYKCSFLQSVLEGAVFNQATLESCSLVQTRVEGGDFSYSTWIASAVASESSLIGADFSHATIRQSSLRQTSLQGANFNEAKIENCDFSEADCRDTAFVRANLAGSLFVRTDFREVDFTDANLMGALLQKSLLGGANFSGANLFRTDLSQSLISKTTRLGRAWSRQVKTLPKRDE